MTSWCHSNAIAGSKQTRNMAAITISSLVTFFSDEPKSIKRGENHFKSDHVLSFSYCPGMINGKIQASMKDKAYKATVSTRVWYCRPTRGGRSLGSAYQMSNINLFFDDSWIFLCIFPNFTIDFKRLKKLKPLFGKNETFLWACKSRRYCLAPPCLNSRCESGSQIIRSC